MFDINSFLDLSLYDSSSDENSNWSIDRPASESFPDSDFEQHWFIGLDAESFESTDSNLPLRLSDPSPQVPDDSETVWLLDLLSSPECVLLTNALQIISWWTSPLLTSSAIKNHPEIPSSPVLKEKRPRVSKPGKRQVPPSSSSSDSSLTTSVSPGVDESLESLNSWKQIHESYSRKRNINNPDPTKRKFKWMYQCSLCKDVDKKHIAYREGDMGRHLTSRAHGPNSVFCPNSGCSSTFTRKDGLERHLKTKSCRSRWIPY